MVGVNVSEAAITASRQRTLVCQVRAIGILKRGLPVRRGPVSYLGTTHDQGAGIGFLGHGGEGERGLAGVEDRRRDD